MKTSRASKTAEAAVAVRFSHMLHDDPKVFEDGLAAAFTSDAWKFVCRNQLLHQVVVRGFLRTLRPVHGLILGRSRYAEEKLEIAMKEGASQYVILGAGFDTYAFRRAADSPALTVFELDHPASQLLKRERLLKLRSPLPCNLHFVPIDFEMHSVQSALERSRYDTTKRSFVAWLGTTFYLTHHAIKETLRAIAHIAAPGSELVFDYLVPDRLVPPSKRSALIATRRFAAQRGEPIVATYKPDEVARLANAAGFIVNEDLAAEDMEFRYFSARKDDLIPMPGSRLIHLRRTI